MNYYALFLNTDNFIEHCLALIRFISNPESRSLPHITLRVFKKLSTQFSDVENTEVTYLNIIEPGAFNLNEKRLPYVIYLRCESDELERIEYKPSFPFSRLHITLYEGDDDLFAKDLFALLSQKQWHFRLAFPNPHQLTGMKIGTKKDSSNFFQHIDRLFKNLINISREEFLKKKADNSYRLDLIKIILDGLSLYINDASTKVQHVKSYYNDEEINPKSKYFNQYIDENASNLSLKDNQDHFNFLDSLSSGFVEKPVLDAIFVTPPEYAKDMAICALGAFGGANKRINFGDSAIGTGALFLSLLHYVDERNSTRKKQYEIESAIGIDIDEKMAREAFVRCSKRGLTVIYGDAISPNTRLGSCRNMMIVNPPYNRHEDIPKEYRSWASRLAEEQTGIRIREY